MALAAAAGAIGKQVVTHAVRAWFGARRERAQRGAELIELVQIGVPDHFKQRRLVRQLEDLADQIGERLRSSSTTSVTCRRASGSRRCRRWSTRWRAPT